MGVSYIGRNAVLAAPSPPEFGNFEFFLPERGSVSDAELETLHEQAELAYLNFLLDEAQDPFVEHVRTVLHGEHLACHCVGRNLCCHGYALAIIANCTVDELRQLRIGYRCEQRGVTDNSLMLQFMYGGIFTQRGQQ